MSIVYCFVQFTKLLEVVTIHLVAGNCRGKNGVMKVNSLLESNPFNDASKSRWEILFGTHTNNNPLHLSLRKRNFRVAIRLWEMQMQCSCDKETKHVFDSGWDIECATLLGEAAIDGSHIKLFQFAVNTIIASSSMGKPADKSIIEKALAKLLLWVVDERSGFGINSSTLEQTRNTKDHTSLQAIAVGIISQQQKQLHLSKLSLWAQDKITGHTPLHLLLRTDRGASLRRSLIQPLCKIMVNVPCEDTPSINLISMHCAEKFGSYTPLHLACALNCKESIKTLIAHGADQNLLDSNDKVPADLLTESISGTDKIKHFLI